MVLLVPDGVGPRRWGRGPGGEAVLRTLRVGGAFPVPRGAAPRGPRLPGGGPLSSAGSSVGTVAGWALQRGFPADDRGGARLSLKKVGGKNTRGKPLDPGFMARSLSLARFGGCAALFRWRGCFGAHVRALIWELSFAKMLFIIFFSENASQIGLRISEEIAPLPYQK